MTLSRSIRLFAASALAAITPAAAQTWQSDSGDGHYANPPLYADYPDPDIIRVGEDFYFITTTFANVPGLTILQSNDLVNWRFASHVVDKLEGRPQYDLKEGGAYRRGLFAASLRHHAGMFYVAVTPVGEKTRIYRAKDVRGPWTMNRIDIEAFDPGLFFDTDGQAYIVTAIGSDGTVTLLTMSPDLTRITDRRVVHFNKGGEGSKLVKRGDWYYLFNAIPSRLGLTVSRAKSLLGPWETRNQIDDTTGGHQGAIVDLPDGTDYGFVMVDAGSIGRMTNISPIHWRDGWPVWGTPDAPGRVPATARKPVQGKPVSLLAASDDFAAPELGLQWQWNHNPLPDRWSLTERPGFLRLKAAPGKNLWDARNTLVQKGQGPRGRGVVELDIAGIRPGDICGFGTFGKISAQLAVVGDEDGKRALTMRVTEATSEGPQTDIRVASIPISGNRLWLRADTDFETDIGRVAYSLDGRRWHEVGGEFPLIYDWRTGTFQGEQFALSCYNPSPGKGYLDIDSFTLSALPAAP